MPTGVAPSPPTVMCWPTVVLVHLATSGVALDQPSTAELQKSRVSLCQAEKENYHIPDSITLNMSQLLIISILIQINAGPATKQRKRSINGPQTAVILELLHGLLLGLAEDRAEECEKLDTLRITSVLALCKLANLPDVLRYYGGAVARHEDSLCMLRGEGLACFRRAGLQDHRCALWAGLAKMRPGHVEVFADVVDLTHAGWVGVDAALAVADDGVLAPGGLP